MERVRKLYLSLSDIELSSKKLAIQFGHVHVSPLLQSIFVKIFTGGPAKMVAGLAATHMSSNLTPEEVLNNHFEAQDETQMPESSEAGASGESEESAVY